MKPLIPIVVSAGLALASAACQAADTHPLQPNAPHTVTVTEADTPPVIRAGLLQSTLIVLPAEEKVANVFAGDTVDWVFDGGHVASRFISVKPKVANGSTDIHIVSDHGNEYTLQLHEVSSEPDAHFDSKIFIAPGDQAAKDRLTQLPVFVPAADLDKAKQEAATAKAAQAAELKAEETKAEQYRSQYPGNLHFDYTWDQSKGKALGLQQIWRDDKFTYLRGQFQESPALYELKDGKGSLINFDFNAGLYTVPKKLDNGYLAIGKQKVEFHRVGGAK
ncbi:TrbG/VirB9 family P-type conjugative transfer protein [Granulicella arctica]|uniref:Type IV secretion system protein VirB9 n=1 Tax=Granulicella arctica TaxID=940613 RepID=A0A7Y9PDN3_9BACT|nr:TrbG/VirB9 family P-type conjugative transfer protein [Granulicella arctica]NYF78001.1 type IV secretion system protein VirB9 [Granulicella arctica]